MSNISLDLFNFELPQNQTCQYVLTSPRSLQACRQLSVRPVDLLPKTEAQVAEERPNLTADQIKIFLRRHEDHRIKILEATRAARETIIRTANINGVPNSELCKPSEFKISSKQDKQIKQNPEEERKHAERKGPSNTEAKLLEDDASRTSEQRSDEKAKLVEKPDFGQSAITDQSGGLGISNCKSRVSSSHEDSVSIGVTAKTVKEKTNKSIRSKKEAREKYETESSEKTIKIFGENSSPSSFLRPKLKSQVGNPRPSSSQKKKRQNRFESPYANALTNSSDVCSVYLLPKSEDLRKDCGSRAKTSFTNAARKKGSESCFWESARTNKQESGSSSLRGSFILRPSSAGRSKPTKAKSFSSKSVKDVGAILSRSPVGQSGGQGASAPFLDHSKQRKVSLPISTHFTRRRGSRHSSDSESSPRRMIAIPDTSPGGVISPEQRQVKQQERGRPTTRKTRYPSSKRRRSRNSKRLGAGSEKHSIITRNLSKSVNYLDQVPRRTRTISPASGSMPIAVMPGIERFAQKTSSLGIPRPVSATSDSSMASISSITSNSLSATSESHGRRRYRNPGLKLRPCHQRLGFHVPSRPTSSLAIPTYLKSSSQGQRFAKPVARSSSAKLPKTSSSFFSPREFHVFSPRSSNSLYKTTSTVSLADSPILAKFLNGIDKNIEVTPHDRRILELLALKHEKLHAEEEGASRKQQKWVEDREKEVKETSQHWQEWRLRIHEKRLQENSENMRRWRELEERYHQSHENLTALLQGKEKRAQELLQNRHEARLRRLEEKKLEESAKKAVITAALQAKEEKLESQRKMLLDLWEKQQRLVEQRKREREELQQKRLGETSIEAREQHEARQRQVEAEGMALLEAMKRSMQERLSRAEANLSLLQQSKYDALKKIRNERDRKSAAVRALHDNLEADLLRWRQHILQKQLETTREAEERLFAYLRNKATMTQERLQTRQEHHRQLFEQVKEKERAEEVVARHLLAAKDLRSAQVTRGKEWKTQRAKNAALATASLREDLRKKFSPETFDRKAARAKVEARIENPPHAQHPLISASHIFLG